MPEEAKQEDMLRMVLGELACMDRKIINVSMDYAIREVPSDGPAVVREHTGERTLTITTVPNWVV